MILESSQDITVRGYDRLLRYLNTVLSFKDENEKGLHGGKISPESPRLKRKPKEEKPDDTPALVTLDLDWVFDVLLGMLKCEEIELEIAEMIVESAAEKFQREGLLVDLDFSESVEDIQTVVVGDIHGQFTDLLYIFEKFGRPCSTRRFIFNGDIVDRGPRSVACWLFLCALKLAVPDYLYVTRGNHESKTVSILFSSFAQECSTFYTTDFYSLCQRTFDDLPISYTLNNSIFVSEKDRWMQTLFTKSTFFLDYSRWFTERLVFRKVTLAAEEADRSQQSRQDRDGFIME